MNNQFIKLLLFIFVFGFHSVAYSQFNTVKKIKVLPQIQIDTVGERTKLKNDLLVVENIDSSWHEPVPSLKSAIVSMPLSQPIINSKFGNRIDPLTGEESFHQGIDFKGSADSVMVIMPGEVKKVAHSRGLGNYIEVEHGEFKTTYGHLSFVMVREKTKLKAGDVIGITGSTGRSTGDHLHFGLKHRGRIINPTPFLDLIYKTLELEAKKKTIGLIKN